MKITHLLPPLVPLLLGGLAIAPQSLQPTGAAALSNVDRSPCDLVLLPDGVRALTTNRTAGTVSLVRLDKGMVLAETPVGQEPFAVALVPGKPVALVSDIGAGTITLVEIAATGLTVRKTISVGSRPRGVVVSKDGMRAWVALSGDDAVAEVSLAQGTVTRRIAVPWEPWHLALAPNGRRLVVGCTRARVAVVIDTATGKVAQTIRTLGRNLRHVAIEGSGKWAYLPMISERGAGVTKENIDRGWIVGNRLCRVPLTEEGPREAITLDIKGDAVGNVDGLTLSPDGTLLAASAAGTHELLLLKTQGLPWIAYGGPGDHLDEGLQKDATRFRRVKLGGRPLGLHFTPDGKQVVVANYGLNALQIVETATGTLSRTIALGGHATPWLARRGEAIFQDADRSFGNWYSCDSCHTEGGTNGGNFDTLNDGGLGKPKKTPSLRGVSETAPYTWHGWQQTLPGAVRESLRRTMQGPEPSDDDVAAVTAYLQTLTVTAARPSHPLSAAEKQGGQVFIQKGCNSCHAAPTFTIPQVVNAGLEEPEDHYKGYNPPSLRGVGTRAPYLHDGRAKTLEVVLSEYHRPSQLAGKPDCTPAQLRAVVAYLKRL